MQYVKCPQGGCGVPVNGGECKGCGHWFCKDHIHRHSNCGEGR